MYVYIYIYTHVYIYIYIYTYIFIWGVTLLRALLPTPLREPVAGIAALYSHRGAVSCAPCTAVALPSLPRVFVKVSVKSFAEVFVKMLETRWYIYKCTYIHVYIYIYVDILSFYVCIHKSIY